MNYTGRTRRRWLFFTQYEYRSAYYRRGCTPSNTDKWPQGLFWTYDGPHVNSVGLLDKVFRTG